MQYYNDMINWLREYPLFFTIICLSVLIIFAWIANFIVKRILVRGITKLLRATVLKHDDVLSRHNVVSRLSNVVPAMVLALGINLVPGLPEVFIQVIDNVCAAFIILTLVLAIGNILDIINVLWQKRPDAINKPIKGYVQIVKIFIYAVATILIIAALIDKSPVILLSGLGAMAAVLMLVFQDTLLSLVASVQISSNGMIRVGDWIEMPQVNADGDVIDIALHTVTVQNWDKTITTIPTKKFLSESFKNWKGMTEAGGRRIKRSIFIDQNSIHFLTKEEEAHLRKFNLLKDYLADKDQEIKNWNKEHGDDYEVNCRRITNLGTFRAYVEKYLRSHPKIHKNMTLLVRQLALTAEGIPLELYCFTNDISWSAYESIQSDIFDHLLAILPEFGLRVFQDPTGGDLANIRLIRASKTDSN
ncbi:mechanosensitive ion channel family protein [Entomomonas asaccharolytica]|uniref:Mechanosensitive ion channel n=1 Tax=Entomomonas asaccharolytica TaxID=2785331 RepID=A0A974RW67_9GAMM|nr:mechanosensitive ion channel domain-containing protein [Entomomonas asaccharolytica]QQP84860.1 mechanosensitive ion channel [Entomomonas asaccharolytica]